MADSHAKKRNLTDQQDALTVYLEALLSEAGFGEPETELDNTALLDEVVTDAMEETVEAIPAEPPTPQQAQLPVETQTVSLPQFINPPVLIPQQVLEPRPAETTTSETGNNNELILQSGIEEAMSRAADDSATNHDANSASAEEVRIPDWAQSRFQCLMFSVAGLKIAAPLEKLNGIIEWPDRITLIPGRAPWFMGLVRNRETNVQIMDLGRILQLNGQYGQYDDSLDSTEPAADRAKYIMLIDDGRIGLASDSVANMLTLEPDTVKWNAGSKKNPLVAGTVVEQMCAVLDVDALIKHINNS